MGYIKQKLFDLAEQVAEGLNKGNNKNNIGKYMFKLLNSEDYDFFVENRQYILELAETLTDVEDNYYKVDSADEKISNNDDYDPASMYESERYIKSGFHFHNLSAGNKVKYNKIEKNASIKEISPINEELIRNNRNQERSIDLKSPDGSAYSILSMAHDFCKQLKKVNPEQYDWERIEKEMTSGDYKNLVMTFKKYFGDYVKIYNADFLDEFYIMSSIFKKSNINEGCNCNGTKPKPKPRPKSRPK